MSFITAAGVSFKTLNPNNLPADNVALDVYLLRGQNLLLTKNYAFNDEVLNMIFSGFTTLIKTVVPVSRDFNQVLVLENKQFKFVPLASEQTYIVNRTTDLDQVFSMMSQILDQETKFLNQLLTFQTMLIDAEVFSTPTPTPTSTVNPPIVARRHAPHTVPLPTTPVHGTGTNYDPSVSVTNHLTTTPISEVRTTKLPIVGKLTANPPVYDIDPPFARLCHYTVLQPNHGVCGTVVVAGLVYLY